MTVYPSDWNPDYDLTDGVRQVLLAADCGWLQAVTQLAFCVGSLLAACEDTEMREAVGEVLAAKLVEVARTGVLPGETMQ
jgi:hypothetical protein